MCIYIFPFFAALHNALERDCTTLLSLPFKLEDKITDAITLFVKQSMGDVPPREISAFLFPRR